MTKFEYSISIFPKNYFVEVQWGVIRCDSKQLDIYSCLISNVFDSIDVSNSIEADIIDSQYLPISVILQYVALTENKVYTINNDITIKSNEKVNICLCPQGNIIIQVGNRHKTTNSLRFNAEESIFEMTEGPYLTIEQYCRSYLDNDFSIKEQINRHRFPSIDLFNNYMKQFTYRYQVIFEHWDEDEEKWIKYEDGKDEVIPEFEYIEESLYDGTHDKLHDGGLMKYHEAGKPKKLALKWHIKKSDYSAYFWFEDEEICAIFNKFYGQHPDTKTDFIIHIDPIKKKYELSLYRYGLKQPVIIPESAYQLIVFKSGFENYRSDNYNQPTGAWIW